MLAARMHEYHKPLVLEDIKVPEILPEQALVRVGGAGMCRSDVQAPRQSARALSAESPNAASHQAMKCRN